MAGKALHFLKCPVRSQRPLKILGNGLLLRLVVLITASGLQGEQPLVHRTM